MAHTGEVMPRRNLVLEDNQPSIKTFLPNCPTCTKPECMEYDPTVPDRIADTDIAVTDGEDRNKIKRRKRKHRSSEALKKNHKKIPTNDPT